MPAQPRPRSHTTMRPLRDGALLADQLADLVVELADEVRRHFGAVAVGLGLSAAQACALHQLDGPLTMGELAGRIGCEPSNVTFLVDRLEARGLVERRPHPRSRRSTQLVLTAAGLQLRQELHDRVARRPPPLGALPPGQQRQLRALLNRALDGARRAAR
jgi:MarR family transcriptional regulator, organic hydroperoxide resistance regulator